MHQSSHFLVLLVALAQAELALGRKRAEIRGRLFNVVGQAIDGLPQPKVNTNRPIHQEPPPFDQLAASTEMGAGILFALGLLTPFAAAGITGLMVVAGWTVHRHNGFFIVKEGWEYNLVIATVAVGVAIVGPGEQSLDWALGLDLSFNPGLAFLIAAVLGVGAGVGLLAAAYRPPLSESS